MPVTSTSEAIIAFGANLPADGRSPAEAVVMAMDQLDPEGAGRRSRLFRTPAFPAGSGPDFVNAAMVLPWSGPAADLLARLHEIEAAFGRTRNARWEARRMDVDLIAFGDQVLPDRETQAAWAGLSPEAASDQAPDRLIVPHPRLAERAFVLVPVADIAPDWRHPLTKQTIRAMLKTCPPEDVVSVVALA
jgi:2-amino-4-hydroxy-6-hydroxymethyldihydropteridine diphosphokinase